MCFALCHTNDVNVLIHFINYNARAHKMYVCDVNVSLAGTLALSDHWLIDRNIQGQHILAHDGTHTFRSIDGQPAQYHSTIRMKFNNLMPYCVRFSSFPVTTVRKERNVCTFTERNNNKWLTSVLFRALSICVFDRHSAHITCEHVRPRSAETIADGDGEREIVRENVVPQWRHLWRKFSPFYVWKCRRCMWVLVFRVSNVFVGKWIIKETSPNYRRIFNYFDF